LVSATLRRFRIWDSVVNSLIVAAGAVVLSLTLGLLAALALDRADFPGKSLFRRLVLLPLILPGIITGLSMLMFAVIAGFQRSLILVFSDTVRPSSPSRPRSSSQVFRKWIAVRKRLRSIWARLRGVPSGSSPFPTSSSL